MSEREFGAAAIELASQRGQEPELATATKEGVPVRSPARRAESGEA